MLPILQPDQRPLQVGRSVALVGLWLSLWGQACKPSSTSTGTGPLPARAGTLTAAPATSPALEHPAGRTAKIRPPAIAGSWYPAERALVVADIAHRMRAASSGPSLPNKPVAMIVPHAGWRYSGDAAAAAFRNLHPGDFTRVVLLGPSHRAAFDGFSLGEWDAYRTPLGEIPVCAETASLLDRQDVQRVEGVERSEHSLEIELPFLQETLRSFCLIPILAGQTTQAQEARLSEKLARLSDGKTLFLISSDFTHYGPRFDYTPFGPTKTSREAVSALQAKAIGLLERKNAEDFRRFLDTTQATICGRRGISVLLELLPKIAPNARSVLLSHYASTDVPDLPEDDSAVWYVGLAYVDAAPSSAASSASAVAGPMLGPSKSRKCTPESPLLDKTMGEKLVRIARATLRTELLGDDDLRRELATMPAVAGEMDRVQAVFVTLKKAGELRGCVGQVEPTYPLPEAIVHAALDAAEHDGRFPPVSADELDAISLEVTALTPPKPVGSFREIQLGKHGIVLTKGGRRALFLPQVPGEQGWTLEETLRALSHKARLPEDAWRDKDASFAVFSGQVFEERDRKL